MVYLLGIETGTTISRGALLTTVHRTFYLQDYFRVI